MHYITQVFKMQKEFIVVSIGQASGGPIHETVKS